MKNSKSKPRIKNIRIYADGQYEEYCNVTPVLEKASRKPWNYPKDPKKAKDKSINRQRALKNSFKAR